MTIPRRPTTPVTPDEARDYLLAALQEIEIFDQVEINRSFSEYADEVITISVKGRKQKKQS